MAVYTVVIDTGDADQDDVLQSLEQVPEVVVVRFMGPGSLVESVPDEQENPDDEASCAGCGVPMFVPTSQARGVVYCDDCKPAGVCGLTEIAGDASVARAFEAFMDGEVAFVMDATDCAACGDPGESDRYGVPLCETCELVGAAIASGDDEALSAIPAGRVEVVRQALGEPGGRVS